MGIAEMGAASLYARVDSFRKGAAPSNSATAGIAAQIKTENARRDVLKAKELCSKHALIGSSQVQRKNIVRAGNAPATIRAPRGPPLRRERYAPSAPHGNWTSSHTM